MLRKIIGGLVVTVVLSACSSKGPTGCTSVTCRPLSEAHMLTIWWQPELRKGLDDYTVVPVTH